MKTSIPICPKCGYDQSGEIATWESSCPVEGRCPECGLEFAWADLLDPSRVDVDWYIEHAKGPWGLVRRTLPTLWYLLIPNRFWKRVGIQTQVQLGHMIAWSVLTIIFLHIVSSVIFVVADFMVAYKWGNGQSSSLLSFITEFDVSIAQQILGNKMWWMDSLTTGFGHPFFRNWWWPDTESTSKALRMLILCFGFTAMWLIILSVIPTTRRLAKLRAQHVLRAMILSFLMPVVFVEIVRLIDAGIFFMKGPFPGSDTIEFFVGLVLAHSIIYGMVFWVQWHWISAIRSGWKIHPNGLLICIGLFGSTVCSYLFASLLSAMWMIMEYS
ncbi:MAG: hypothetical protein JKX70_03725 [Phycisphaerales bacterium]|nr:hypothetical protein [Phycisphaerales bacterium]